MSWMEKRRRAMMRAAAVPPLVLDPVFANNDWAAIIAACQRKQVPDTWAVGDQKAMTIGGRSYMIDIIGKDHDAYADGSGTAPLTLQMHGCYSKSYAMRSDATNTDGWENAIVRTTAMSDILNGMPDEVQAAVREVAKLTGTGQASTTIITTADKLFIPSEVEVVGEASLSAPGEGTQYPYYETHANRLKYAPSGTNVEWWTRSPVVTSTLNYVRFYASGNAYSAASKNNSYIAAAWCF